MGAFGRRVKNRYGKATSPFRADWNRDKEMMEYEMSAKNALLVLSQVPSQEKVS